MFPFDLDDEEDVVEQDEITSQPTDYEIDFTTGELTGRVITGLPAIVQWIRLTLSTDRYYFNQFSWDYGSELETLIGPEYSQETTASEVARMVTDALSTNPDIDSVSDFDVVMENDHMTVTFTVNTIYGSEEVSVNV